MSKKFEKKRLALTIGAAVATSLSAGSIANAETNPFGMSELSNGYMQIAQEEKKAGMSCGAKMKESSSGDKKAEGSCAEGKCGEGKCAGAKKVESEAEPKKADGSCGEGKCGEGKCAGKKSK